MWFEQNSDMRKSFKVIFIFVLVINYLVYSVQFNYFRCLHEYIPFRSALHQLEHGEINAVSTSLNHFLTYIKTSV